MTTYYFFQVNIYLEKVETSEEIELISVPLIDLKISIKNLFQKNVLKVVKSV